MKVIRWEDPPPRSRGREQTSPDDNTWPAAAASLRAQPGRWAVIWEGDDPEQACRLALRVGRSVARPFRAFEVAVRTVAGTRTVYARYVGGVAT